MIIRTRIVLWLALLLLATACGGTQDSEAGGSPTGEEPDWGSGKTYDQCTEEGLTNYGLRTGQKWIGDFYADLYDCRSPDSLSTDAIPYSAEPDALCPDPPGADAGTLPPLRQLCYQPVFTNVRETLGDDFAMPVQITAVPGGERTYLITREGRVWVVEPETFARPPVLDIREFIAAGSETGLLGIAVHPIDPHRLFLYYTNLEHDIILAEYRLDETLRRALPESAQTVLHIPTKSDFHKGGMISFGPDGYLYIGVGDDGSSFTGQDPTSLLGAILRIDVDQGAPYAIPDDHPPVSPEAPEVYFYGIRNPWRFWVDPEANVMYIGDVGADAFEEVNIAALDTPGTNFGWSVLEGHQWGPFNEGVACRENPENCDTSTFTGAALALAHSPEICAVVGGVVYRGEAIPELVGHFFYSDVCGGFLRSLRWDGSLAMDLRDWTPESGKLTRLLSFGVDTRREMYVMTADDVFRIQPIR